MTASDRDVRWMRRTLDLARRADREGEVPVGALVVRNHVVIGEGFNRRELDLDPTAHAEVVAIRQAAQTVRSWRLEDCTLYVTLEPCIQCCGSILLARIPRLIYGASDPKAGAVESLYRLLEDSRLNHRVNSVGGVLAEECGELLTAFFGRRRERLS